MHTLFFAFRQELHPRLLGTPTILFDGCSELGNEGEISLGGR